MLKCKKTPMIIFFYFNNLNVFKFVENFEKWKEKIRLLHHFMRSIMYNNYRKVFHEALICLESSNEEGIYFESSQTLFNSNHLKKTLFASNHLMKTVFALNHPRKTLFASHRLKKNLFPSHRLKKFLLQIF